MEFPIQAETSSFNTYFCLLLANNILQAKGVENGSNTVISPFSFHLLLSLIAVGSKGRTLEQLFHCLGSKSLEDINSLASQMVDLASPFNKSNGVSIGEPDLSFVNAAWVAQSLKLKPSFQEIVEGVYHAIAKEADFANKAEQVVAEVNAWAETATRGLIRNLLTAEALKRYLYRSFNRYKILKLPYKTSQPTRKFAMHFFLPDAKDGLKNLLQMFKSNPEYFNKRFDLVNEKIFDFWVPRFKFEFEFEASEAMIKMGLDLPFNRSKAEITEMVDSVTEPLFVRKMFHKCLIEVNEEGTEAAASTAVIIEQQQQSVYPNPSFVADHPFMFMIKEETSGVVIFVGAVLNPSLDS
ncbi:hypothetical protein V6Z11_A11G065400 [Gossypium hirsutum]